MTKKLKRLSALVLALMMCLLNVATAFAATNHTLTINKAEKDHVYKIYQLATGDVSTKTVDGEEKFVLSNIKAGQNASNVTQAVLEGLTGTETEIADAAYKLIDDLDNPFDTVSGQTEDTEVKLTVPGGYYIVVDTATDEATNNPTVSKYMVSIVGDTVMIPKKENLPGEKKIDENENGSVDESDVDVNTANIGDKVPYVYETKVPDVSHYTSYNFAFQDKMSAGLTYNNDLKVYINGGEVPVENYKVEFEATKNQINLVFVNPLTYFAGKAGQRLDFVYSATVNDDAYIGNTPNTNDGRLVFPTNPNEYDGGQWEPGEIPEPGEVEGIGGTTWDQTKTYVTSINLHKIDGENNTINLSGAVFLISGTGTKTTYYKEVSNMFEKVEEGATHYLLTDGSFTDVDPVTAAEGNTEDSYVKDEDGRITKQYKQIQKVINSTTTEEAQVAATGVSDANGNISFVGLYEGTYTLTEIKAPEGYNLLAAPLTVVITFDEANERWSATVDGVDVNMDSGSINYNVENNAGVVLPSTGGIGTTIFYVIGGILVVGAGVLLVTKKRMSSR